MCFDRNCNHYLRIYMCVLTSWDDRTELKYFSQEIRLGSKVQIITIFSLFLPEKKIWCWNLRYEQTVLPGPKEPQCNNVGIEEHTILKKYRFLEKYFSILLIYQFSYNFGKILSMQKYFLHWYQLNFAQTADIDR